MILKAGIQIEILNGRMCFSFNYVETEKISIKIKFIFRKSKMNEEELILHVQSYCFLYDLTDTRYSNTLIRENAWEEIGIKMKCKGKIIFIAKHLNMYIIIIVRT